MAEKKEKRYVSDDAHLMAEWDWEKNAGESPFTTTIKNNRKVWWKCKQGHEWQSVVSSRSAGRNCPICANQRILSGYNDLATLNPSLALEWHPTKNGNLTPTVVSVGSPKKAWWKCLNGHEWQASIGSRNRGSGCPYCANQKVLPGYNDFESQFPELLQEWDYSKNDLIPSQTIATTDKNAWWICRICGYNWTTKISQRTRLGRGCPQCGIHTAWNTRRQQIAYTQNSLMTSHPKLAAEWHPTKNTLSSNLVTHGSNLKVWWLCPLGHEYQAAISSRAINGTGCPVCANKQVLQGYNDLQSQFPEIAKEWHPKNKLRSDEVMSTSIKKFWWQCHTCGHEYQKSVENRTKYHHHCPKCNTRTSIAETFICHYLSQVNVPYIQSFRPEWMDGKEIDVFLPQYKLAIEYDGMLYHQNVERDVSKSNILRATGITLLRIREQGCPELQTNDIIFEHRNPEEYSMLTQTLFTVFAYLNQTYNIQQPDINVERDMQKVMAERAKLQKERSIAFLRPDLLLEWDYERNIVSPDLVSVSSEVKIHWSCQTCGYRWKAIAGSRTKSNGSGCPVCAGRVVMPGYNDLATQYPELAKQWSNRNIISPTEVTIGSHRDVWWKCDKGHEWSAKIYSRSQGAGCPYCYGRIAIKGYNDLQTVNPQLAKEWNYEKNNELTPSDVMPNSGKKVWWKCSKGHEWQASVTKRNYGRGCPECAKQKRKKKDSQPDS